MMLLWVLQASVDRLVHAVVALPPHCGTMVLCSSTETTCQRSFGGELLGLVQAGVAPWPGREPTVGRTCRVRLRLGNPLSISLDLGVAGLRRGWIE